MSLNKLLYKDTLTYILVHGFVNCSGQYNLLMVVTSARYSIRLQHSTRITLTAKCDSFLHTAIITWKATGSINWFFGIGENWQKRGGGGGEEGREMDEKEWGRGEKEERKGGMDEKEGGRGWGKRGREGWMRRRGGGGGRGEVL